MVHAQKPYFVFRRNGRVHLNRPEGSQFSPLLAAEVCASAVVMLNTPCSEVVWRVLTTHCIRQFPLHFPSRPSPCAITFLLESTSKHKQKEAYWIGHIWRRNCLLKHIIVWKKWGRIKVTGRRGRRPKHTVAQLVKALRYKPKGREFDSRSCCWNFWLTYCFRPHHGLGFYSASNINKYQEYFLEVKVGRCVRLTTLPHFCAECLEIWGPQPAGILRVSRGLHKDSISIFLDSSWNVMAHDAQEGKWRGNWRMEWVASTLHTTSEHGVSNITTADAHTSAASSRLNWRPSADLKGLVRFARKTKSGFCACAITFQLVPTTQVMASSSFCCNESLNSVMFCSLEKSAVLTTMVYRDRNELLFVLQHISCVSNLNKRPSLCLVI